MEKIGKILVISLSNIGDVILTTPVIENLKKFFPFAKIDVLLGPRGREVLEKDKQIRSLIVYNKKASLKEKIFLIKKLRNERYDLVIDLRHTIIPLLIKPRYRTAIFQKTKERRMHMCKKHLKTIEFLRREEKLYHRIPTVHFDEEDDRYIENLLKGEGINKDDLLIVVSPGARSSTKCWELENFVEVIPFLLEDLKAKIILVGSQEDYYLAQKIKDNFRKGVYNFCGKTTIPQLVALLKRAKILITNDSAVLHCGSAVNIPTISIFGPTDPLKYGPLAKDSIVLRRLLPCVPCEKAQCKYESKKCLKLVKSWEVIEAVKKILNKNPLIFKQTYKRILVIRTDRIGDVVLSTPVIKNLRENFPQSFIAMMVRPYTKDIVEGNPFLDEVIVYDKDGKDKSILATLRFVFNLKRYKFDLAIILHPTNRVHIISFLAGIPKRVGYRKKLGFLNTDRLEEKKYLGEKHELEYNLDLLRYLKIEIYDKNLFVPIDREAEERIESFLQIHGLKENDFVVVHPGASCPSKIWPPENFAFVCDSLMRDFGLNVLIVTDKKDSCWGESVQRFMEYNPILALGEFSLKELAVVLKKAKLFISNDSGPVHIAVAVGTPVISIFGRKQPGLSPKRWGPLGEKDIVLHKDIGCQECLAHSCKIGFKCLREIKPQEVIEAVKKIFQNAKKEIPTQF